MNKPLILIVEDDPPIRNLISVALESHDYRCLVACNASGAMLEATSHNPDIMLLDLGLPDQDGMEVIRKIRSWSNMPIIVISARSDDPDKIDALDAGADDYLTKPFSVDELLARLRVTLRRLHQMQNEGPETAVFVNGPLTIDYAAGCACMNGEELHLTPIEYKLLCLLARNVGKVLTHKYITQHIWGSLIKSKGLIVPIISTKQLDGFSLIPADLIFRSIHLRNILCHIKRMHHFDLVPFLTQTVIQPPQILCLKKPL